MTKFLATITLVRFFVACTYDTQFSECTVRCDNDSGCPEGLACGNEGFCRSPGVAATCSAILGDAGGDAPQFSNCKGLAATCGPTASDNCCSAAITIPGGTFYRSYDVATDGMYPSMSYPATISPFVLDKYEVTAGRFRQFVETRGGTRANPPTAKSGAHAKILDSGWDSSWNGNLATDTASLTAAVKCDSMYQTWTDTAGGNENLPMNCITWYEAMAFCIWDGGYLPTEAEWNFAASGGSEQRAYPWSSPAASTTIDCSYANYKNGTSYCVNSLTGAANRVGSESPKGDGRWGQSDIEGNMFEWALDWYADPYPTTTCDDCANLTPTSLRAIRGGGFNANAPMLRTGRHLVVDPPTTRFINVGFRCARSP